MYIRWWASREPKSFWIIRELKQNRLGPKEEGMPQFDIMKVTLDGYEDFVCDVDGTIINYDEE